MKKKEKNIKHASVSIIVFILVILIVVILASSIGSNCKKTLSNIAVSIDKDGNVYDGNQKYLGKLGDENIKFLDENGKILGTAKFNLN